MSIRNRREKPQLNSTINVTNLVDVTMTILIMYIIVAPFVDQGIAVVLPKSATKDHVPPHELVLTITSNKSIYIGEVKVTVQELEKKLRSIASADEKIAVNLQGDGKTDYQSVVEVLDIVRRSGITNIGLATEVKVEKR